MADHGGAVALERAVLPGLFRGHVARCFDGARAGDCLSGARGGAVGVYDPARADAACSQAAETRAYARWPSPDTLTHCLRRFPRVQEIERMSDASAHPSRLTSPAPDASVDPFLSLKSGATEVYLIRHGDALPGADEVVDGGYDEQGLSELGRRQAQALGARMRSVPLAAVYSSPIGRARQTAEAVAVAAGLTVQIEADLREVAL